MLRHSSTQAEDAEAWVGAARTHPVVTEKGEKRLVTWGTDEGRGEGPVDLEPVDLDPYPVGEPQEVRGLVPVSLPEK